MIPREDSRNVKAWWVFSFVDYEGRIGTRREDLTAIRILENDGSLSWVSDESDGRERQKINEAWKGCRMDGWMEERREGPNQNETTQRDDEPDYRLVVCISLLLILLLLQIRFRKRIIEEGGEGINGSRIPATSHRCNQQYSASRMLLLVVPHPPIHLFSLSSFDDGWT